MRIRPGFWDESHRQEPDTHQARDRDRQPGARVQREGAERARARTPARPRARRLEKTIPDTQGSGKKTVGIVPPASCLSQLAKGFTKNPKTKKIVKNIEKNREK